MHQRSAAIRQGPRGTPLLRNRGQAVPWSPLRQRPSWKQLDQDQRELQHLRPQDPQGNEAL